MRLSARAEYACVAMLELALHYGSKEPVCVKAIAARHGIPHGFLVQILLQLKAAGYVTSTRGSAGGYRLARPPARICLAELLNAIDAYGPVDYDLPSSEASAGFRAVRATWERAARQALQVLQQTTLADLAERAAAETSLPVVGDWI